MTLSPTPDDHGRGPDVAERIEAVVAAVPGVHSLHGGALGQVGTYLPGRRVAGIRITDTGAEIHLVVEVGAPLLPTCEAVRVAVRPMVLGPVDVTVEDVAPAGPDLEAPAESA